MYNDLLRDQLDPQDKKHLQRQTVCQKAQKSQRLTNPSLQETKKFIVCIPRSEEDNEISYANKVLDYFLAEKSLTRDEL